MDTERSAASCPSSHASGICHTALEGRGEIDGYHCRIEMKALICSDRTPGLAHDLLIRDVGTPIMHGVWIPLAAQVFSILAASKIAVLVFSTNSRANVQLPSNVTLSVIPGNVTGA